MTLSLRDMKIIAHEIISEELESNGLNVNIMPYTFVEYSGSNTLKNPTILEKASKWLLAKRANGYFDTSKNNVVIFLDHFKKIKNVDNKLISLARTCYHETRHVIQMNYSPYSFDGFMNGIDNVNYADYIISHDSRLFEIDANLFGIKKAKEYILKNYPEYYEENKEEIELREQIYNLEYLTYDAPSHIDAAVSFYKKIYLLGKSEKVINSDELNKRFYFNNIKPVIEIFFDKKFNI